jgi:TRAP-type transport system periplasmic protein
MDILNGELNRRRFLRSSLAVGLAGTASLAAFIEACGGTPSGTSSKTYTMKLNWGQTLTYSMGVMSVKFKELVEKSTSGHISVQLFPNAQLGTEVANLQGLQAGTIEGYAGSSGAIVATVPEFGILDLPYLFDSADHQYRAMDGSYGATLKAAAAKKGFHVLSFQGYGYRDTFCNVRGISTPADMKGLRLRTLQSPVFIAAFKAFGAVPTALAFTEIYLAVKQGVLDGAESGFGGLANIKLYEVAKFASLTHHAISGGIFAVSKQWFDSLPQDLQAAIQTAADEATKVQRLQSVNENDLAQKTFETNGVTIVKTDTKPFQTIAEQVWTQFYTQYGKDNIDAIRKLA